MLRKLFKGGNYVRKYGICTIFFLWNCNNSILRSSNSSYFLFNYFCPLITSCCLLHFSKDQSEAKLKWQMTPIFFAFVSYIRKLVEEWHRGWTYIFNRGLGTLNENFFLNIPNILADWTDRPKKLWGIFGSIIWSNFVTV